MNMYTPATEPDVYQSYAQVLQAMAQPSRLRILVTLIGGEACVCHLESMLQLRQAYLSQQLMVLRQAGLVQQRREGKHIYYFLANPGLIPPILKQVADQMGFETLTPGDPIQDPIPGCPCPTCIQASETLLLKATP